MLDTLEREYRTLEDIHEKLKIYTDDEIQKILLDRLEQLDENKHSFLRVCIRSKSSIFRRDFLSYRPVRLLDKNPISSINMLFAMQPTFSNPMFISKR